MGWKGRKGWWRTDRTVFFFSFSFLVFCLHGQRDANRDGPRGRLREWWVDWGAGAGGGGGGAHGMIDIYVLENCKYISTCMSRTSRTHRRAEDSVPWPGDRLVSRLLRKFAPLAFTYRALSLHGYYIPACVPEGKALTLSSNPITSALISSAVDRPLPLSFAVCVLVADTNLIF